MNLREALFSEYNSSVLWKICESQHLSEDKIYKIATLTGDAIMGFMHPEDLAQEIKNETGIVMEVANAVSRDINRKIFIPIRSDIDKVYSPVAALAEEDALAVSAEEKEEIKETAKGGFLSPKAVSVEDTVDLRTMKKLADDKQSVNDSQQPKIEKESEKPEVQPFIIHKEEGVDSVIGVKRSFGGLFGMFSGKEKKQETVKAKIEIGGEKEEKLKEKEIVSSQPKMKVVHYSDFKTTIGDIRPMIDDRRPATGDKREDLPVPPPPKPAAPLFPTAAPVPPKPKTPLDIPEINPLIESPARVAAHVFEEQKIPVPPKPEIKSNPEQESKPAPEGDVIDLRTMKKI